jgi:ankyrin repeat protein
VNQPTALAFQFLEAVKAGDSAVVKDLLAAQPELVDARDPGGISAVMLAVYYIEPQIANLLIERGAALGFFEASALGKTAPLREMLVEAPELVNSFSPDGFQALGLAAFFGHDEALAILLEAGAQVNTPSRNAMQVTPLSSAAAGQRLEIAQRLLEYGADANTVQAGGFTPLHSAAQNGQLEMAALLLSYGAQVNARSQDGKTPLAMAEDSQAMADLLQEAGGTL